MAMAERKILPFTSNPTVQGLVIKVDGIPAEGLPWQDVKDAMMEYGQVGPQVIRLKGILQQWHGIIFVLAVLVLTRV